MSPIELRLRQRIDALSDRVTERDAEIKTLLFSLKQRNLKPNEAGKREWRRRCAYCGGKCRSRSYPTVCPAHSDLPKVDDRYVTQ